VITTVTIVNGMHQHQNVQYSCSSLFGNAAQRVHCTTRWRTHCMQAMCHIHHVKQFLLVTHTHTMCVAHAVPCKFHAQHLRSFHVCPALDVHIVPMQQYHMHEPQNPSTTCKYNCAAMLQNITSSSCQASSQLWQFSSLSS